MGLQCANRRPDGTDMLKSCTHGLPSGLTGPRRMLVHAAVLLLALSLLSPATGLQGAGRQGCTAFVSRNIVQSVFTLLPPVRLHLNRHRPENTEAHGLHRSPPRGGGGFKTPALNRSMSRSFSPKHSSMCVCTMCATTDETKGGSIQPLEDQDRTASPYATESDPGESLIQTRRRREKLQDSDDGKRDPLLVLQSNSTISRNACSQKLSFWARCHMRGQLLRATHRICHTLCLVSPREKHNCANNVVMVVLRN